MVVSQAALPFMSAAGKPVDANAASMCYRYRGKQYVVVDAGGHFMFNRPLGDYFHAFALP